MKTNQQSDFPVMHSGLAILQQLSGENSRDHGFHEDWPVVFEGENEANNREYQLAIVEKLGLVHEEISEALGEIRSGHAPTETYYTRTTKDSVGQIVEQFKEQAYDEDGRPLLKPEGFGVELADAVIRIADLAYLTGIDLGALVIEKAAYNATRPFKHGRKF